MTVENSVVLFDKIALFNSLIHDHLYNPNSRHTFYWYFIHILYLFHTHSMRKRRA